MSFNVKRVSAYLLWIICLLQAATAFAQSVVSLDFSNDVWNKTDRYYTTGWRLAYMSPKLARPVVHWFPKISAKAVRNMATIDVFQDAYTPSTYNTNVYNPNDRPYSAVLATTYSYVQQSEKSAVQARVLLGLIGKEALGEDVQNKVHDIIDNLHAMGWAYQVKTGVLANIGLGYEHNLIDLTNARVSGVTGAALGTYKINAQLGATVYIGKQKETYSLPLKHAEGKWFSHQLIIQSIATAVVHDATLQGALFQNYTYGLPADKVEHLTLRSKLEYRVLLGHFQLDLSQYIQSPEFDAALWHKWVTIKLGYWF